MRVSEIITEGFEQEAEAYKQHLLKTLPQMMRFYEKNVKGWRPSEEQMLAAIDTGYAVMKHTGNKQQAGKAVMDELNALHRMSQGQGVAEDFRLDEGLGDWIYKKIDDLIGEPKPSARAISVAMKSAPPNLPDDVAEKLVADFMKKKEAQRLAQQAAEAQKTTVEKIVPYLTYFAREFKRRWEQIPLRDRQNALRNLAHNILNLLLFILKAMASSKK